MHFEIFVYGCLVHLIRISKLVHMLYGSEFIELSWDWGMSLHFSSTFCHFWFPSRHFFQVKFRSLEFSDVIKFSVQDLKNHNCFLKNWTENTLSYFHHKRKQLMSWKLSFYRIPFKANICHFFHWEINFEVYFISKFTTSIRSYSKRHPVNWLIGFFHRDRRWRHCATFPRYHFWCRISKLR